jgi:hypothetical protein
MFKRAVKSDIKLRLAISSPAGSGKIYAVLAVATMMAAISRGDKCHALDSSIPFWEGKVELAGLVCMRLLRDNQPGKGKGERRSLQRGCAGGGGSPDFTTRAGV